MSIDAPGTALLDASAFIDDFARRGLPPAELWPMIDQGALARLGSLVRAYAAADHGYS